MYCVQGKTHVFKATIVVLTLSWPRFLSYRSQFIDLLCESMDWFIYDRDLRHERVNPLQTDVNLKTFPIS